jgi:recombination protein RecT
MSEVATTKPNQVVGVIRNDRMQKMFEERLGKRSGQFVTSLISVVNSSPKIAECEPMTVIQAALTAASMDLPINQNLGFAYIIPYKNSKKIDGRWSEVMEAQFQMGYKGFIQLAQRSGTFKTINTTEVRESEVRTRDRMTGEMEFNWIQDDNERNSKGVVGYLAFFELLNGFKKSLYMTKAEIEDHANRYSQAYKSKGKSSFKSPWETDFDLMAQKTALKLLLSKYAPLSTEMQEAIVADQSVDDGNGRQYVDNNSSMENVKADDQKMDDIVNMNQENSGEVVHAVNSEPEASEFQAPAPKPKSVKEKAAEFVEKGKAANAAKKETQGTLVEDDNQTS